MNNIKTKTVVVKKVKNDGDGYEYCLHERLFLCGRFVKRVLGRSPDYIKVTGSTAPFKGAKRIFIHPGWKSWGWNSKNPNRNDLAGMYSYMSLMLYSDLGINTIGTERPWFAAPELEPLTKPVALYVKIVGARKSQYV